MRATIGVLILYSVTFYKRERVESLIGGVGTIGTKREWIMSVRR